MNCDVFAVTSHWPPPYAFRLVSCKFSKVAFKSFPMFALTNNGALFRSFNEDHWALLLSTPVSYEWSMVRQLFSTVFFLLSSSVQFGKAHMRSTPSHRSFTPVAFDTVLMLVWLTMVLSRPFKEGRWEVLSTPVCYERSMVWCSWCLRLLNTLRSPETQAACGGCFAHQSVCAVISLDSCCQTKLNWSKVLIL